MMHGTRLGLQKLVIVQSCTTDDEHLVQVSQTAQERQRIGGGAERETSCFPHVPRVVDVAREHHVDAVRQWSVLVRQRRPRTPAHQHRMPVRYRWAGERAEALHIDGGVVEERVAVAGADVTVCVGA